MQKNNDERIKKKIAGPREFFISYGIMLLFVGFQMGIIVFPGFQNLSEFFKINIIMIYWAIVAFVFLLTTNWQIKKGYDTPMRRLSEAAKKVAEGDFSVYVEPIHTPDSYDYIDVMFLDFNKMVQELGSIETLKNDFVSNVSHEIKTPLAVIKNYTKAMQSKGLSSIDREEYMNTIVEAADKLSNLVSNILRLNKIDNQEIKSETEQFDLCRQLSECALNFSPLLDVKKIEFTVDIEDRALICADKDMLEIVWNNLLSNAIKYTPQGGRISLSQHSSDDTITVSVADTGVGMNDETLKHIFDKFYQADVSHNGEGNGLGLALVQRIIERDDLTIAVTSEIEKGSVFSVTMPASTHLLKKL